MTNFKETRLGILGGSFNPVHIGHLLLAQSLSDKLELSRILFIPCACPPHKKASSLLPAKHRLAMLELAVEGNIHFEVSDIEIQRGGTSYSVDTVRQLKEQYPDVELNFIVGTDTLKELHTWRKIEELLSLCRVVAAARPGPSTTSLSVNDIKLPAPWPERLIGNIVSSRLIDISSSDIRYRLAEGLSVRFMVPQSVEMYILEHRLWTTRNS
jgi:nicotinate-nucleotide adenylyltransferase